MKIINAVLVTICNMCFCFSILLAALCGNQKEYAEGAFWAAYAAVFRSFIIVDKMKKGKGDGDK